jgi:hypothetical protein
MVDGEGHRHARLARRVRARMLGRFVTFTPGGGPHPAGCGPPPGVTQMPRLTAFRKR